MAQSPNVVLFFTDQQRFDTTGAHGNPMGLTPNFDRLCREGTHFCNTFTCQPVCAPARASLQTGLYATRTSVWQNGCVLNPELPTLATWFKSAGYATGYIGKWHLASGDPVPRNEQGGYDFWLGANLLEFVSDAYDLNLFDRDGTRVSLPGYRVDGQTDAAIRFVSDHRDGPFFLCLSYLEPHHQNTRGTYPAPTGYEEIYNDPWCPPDLRELGGSSSRHLPGYYGMVRRLDEALGRLEDALRSMQLLDNTIIVFVSDHGNHFMTRNSEFKRSCHESSIRVPCFAVGPGFRAGGRRSELFSTVDIAPTLLDAAGLGVPANLDGRSIMSTLHDGWPAREKEPWPEHVFVQVSEAETGRAVRTGRWKYAVTHLDASDPDTLPNLERADTYTESYLYDLENDPYELRNLVGYDTHAAVAEEMKGFLLGSIADVEGEAPAILPAPVVSGGRLDPS